MRAAAVIAGWGVLMAAIGAIGVLVWGFDDVEPPALFGGTAAVMVLIGLLLALTRRGDPDEAAAYALPDTSPATAWLGISIVLLAVSAELGLWLALISAGMIAAGIGGLARELIAQRRAAAAVEGEGDAAPGGAAGG